MTALRRFSFALALFSAFAVATPAWAGSYRATFSKEITGKQGGDLAIDGYSFTFTREGRGASRISGIELRKTTDRYTASFLDALAKGRNLGTVRINFTEGNKKISMKLTKVSVSKVEHGEASKGKLAPETIGLNFEKIEWTFTDANGSKSSFSN